MSQIVQTALGLTASRRLLWGLGSCILALVLLSLVLGWRWALVALMLALVLAPALLAWVYFSTVLSPGCVYDSLPHTVTFTSDSLILSGEIPEESEKGKVKSEKGKVKSEKGKVKSEKGKVKSEKGKVKSEQAKEKSEKGEEESEKAPSSRPFRRVVPYSQVARTRVGLNALVLYLKGSPVGLVHIPYDALTNPRSQVPEIQRLVTAGCQ